MKSLSFYFSLWIRKFKERHKNWLMANWTPRVGDRIEFVYPPRMTTVNKFYKPQTGDRGTITSTYLNYWERTGLIIALDNGHEINYEFPHKNTMRLIGLSRSRKLTL